MVNELLAIFKESHNSFEGQKPNEKVIMLLRRHYFTILLPLAIFFFAALIPIVMYMGFAAVIDSRGWLSLFLLLSGLWYMGIWLSMFYNLTMYSLNTVIITSHRIITREQFGFFSRKVSELHPNRIQDVTTQTHGAIETVLKYGDVHVQTAASEKQFIFYQVPHPEAVKDAIMDLAKNPHAIIPPGEVPLNK